MVAKQLRLDLTLSCWPRTPEVLRVQCCRSIRVAIAQTDFPVRVRQGRSAEQAWARIPPVDGMAFYQACVNDHTYLLPHALRQLDQRLQTEGWPDQFELLGVLRDLRTKSLMLVRRDAR